MATQAPLSLSLTDAAYQAGMTYDRMRTAVLLGRIEGGRDDDGKWRVDARSLADFLAAQNKQGRTPLARERFNEMLREGPVNIQRTRRSRATSAEKEGR